MILIQPHWRAYEHQVYGATASQSDLRPNLNRHVQNLTNFPAIQRRCDESLSSIWSTIVFTFEHSHGPQLYNNNYYLYHCLMRSKTIH